MRAPQPLAGVLTLSDRELVLGHAERLQPRSQDVVCGRDGGSASASCSTTRADPDSDSDSEHLAVRHARVRARARVRTIGRNVLRVRHPLQRVQEAAKQVSGLVLVLVRRYVRGTGLTIQAGPRAGCSGRATWP